MRRWLYQIGSFSSGLILFIGLSIEVVQANDFPFKIKSHDVSFYGRLIKKLGAEGLDLRRLKTIFSDSRVHIYEEVLDRNIVFRESKASYRSFTRPGAMTLARRFMAKHRSFLQSLEAKYGTSKEVIVAILLVESSLGKRPGRYGLVSVFSSLSMLAWPDIARPCKTWLKGRHPHLEDAYLDMRLKARSQWAFQELVHLFQLEEKAALVDVLKMKGSWAGAFGLCQFLPSSMERYGADGDGDGKMKLEEPYDAMASVANYLKHTGWKKGLSKRQKEKVLLQYNYSDLYVEAILKITKKLGKG